MKEQRVASPKKPRGTPLPVAPTSTVFHFQSPLPLPRNHSHSPLTTRCTTSATDPSIQTYLARTQARDSHRYVPVWGYYCSGSVHRRGFSETIECSVETLKSVEAATRPLLSVLLAWFLVRRQCIACGLAELSGGYPTFLTPQTQCSNCPCWASYKVTPAAQRSGLQQSAIARLAPFIHPPYPLFCSSSLLSGHTLSLPSPALWNSIFPPRSRPACCYRLCVKFQVVGVGFDGALQCEC